jgi:hypothetical protein
MPDRKTAIMNDPSTSTWLKQQIVSLDERDIVDAIADIEVLLSHANSCFKDQIASAQVVICDKQLNK